MIKIAYIIDSLMTDTGGTENQLLMLMRNLDRTRFKPYLCVLHDSEWMQANYKDPYFIAGISSFKKPSALLGMLRLARFLKREQFDIVQTFFSDANKAGILAAKLAGTPLIISSRRNQGYWHTKGELAALKFLNPWAQLFIANSRSTCRWAQEVEGIAGEKIKVVYNGLDLGLYGLNAETLRARYRCELGVKSDTVVVGMVANLRPVKGHDVLLQAARLVVNEAPHVHFLLVGSGELRQQLQGLACELGIERHISFLGQRRDIPQLLNSFDIGVLSSNSESSSNAVVEYLAAGLPVVSTDVGGAREAIDDGLNGFVVPVGDHVAFANRMLDILRRNNFREMGDNSRRRAEEFFSVTAMIKNHEDIYSEGLQGVFNRSLKEIVYLSTKFVFCSLLSKLRINNIIESLTSPRVIILTYHSIDEYEDINGLKINAKTFGEQLQFLMKNYHIVSLEEAVSRLKNGKLDQTCIVVTFDDGYIDNYATAYPLLAKHGIPATIFVACQAIDAGIYDWLKLDTAIYRLTCNQLDLSNFGLGYYPLNTVEQKKVAIQTLHMKLKAVDHQARRSVIAHITDRVRVDLARMMMDWSQVRELAQSGLVTIGAHTVTHPILSKVSTEQAWQEIAESKRIIEQQTDLPVHYFSYPNGTADDFTDESVEIVKSSGYLAACTAIKGYNRPGDDLFRLKRIDVTYGMCRGIAGRFSDSMFAAHISGAIGFFNWIRPKL